ncbi:MAG: 50S ribosomal protein L10 [Patescibacteria group bacterium]|nr:50S ribosomal protein L10 [Patescibacteria group bacterium]
MPNKKKVSQVESYSSLVESNPDFFVVSYDRTTHKAMEDLRKKLREANSSLTVLKNTLFEKAIEKQAVSNEAIGEIKEKAFPLKGSSALVTTSGDWSTGLKAFAEYIKKDQTMAFKFGFLDGTAYDGKSMESIAKLPAKPELMAKVIGVIKSPMVKTVVSFKFTMQTFVTVLSEAARKEEASS